MARNFVFVCVLAFFCFHAKAGSTKNDRNDLSDISY